MTHNTDRYEQILRNHNIRPTAIRILVYGAITRFHDTFSMADVEEALESVDSSSVFRAISLFVEHHLLHEVEDGSKSKKYCLCRNDHECRIDEFHCHFYCERCQKTFCMDTVPLPVVNAPEGFVVTRINYLMKGLCADCRKAPDNCR